MLYNDFRMVKNKLVLHQIVLFGFLGILVLWSVIRGSFVFNLDLLWWLLGAVLGFLFVFGDRVVYLLVSNPNEALSIKIKDLLKQNKIGEGTELLLKERYDQKELVMRSFLFLIVWIAMAFFAMTSVVNAFARGLILGIGMHIEFDLIYDYLFDKERLDLWFWQIKRTLEPEEKFWFVVITGFAFILLAFNL